MRALLKYVLDEVKNRRMPKATAMELMKHLHNTSTKVGREVKLHPLVHHNTSNFNEQRFTSRFSGDESFLKDHQVGEKKVLPGAAYLEMAREAVAQTISAGSEAVFKIKNVIWASPLVVEDGADEPVSISLINDTETSVNYEVYTGKDGEAVVHSQGNVEIAQQDSNPKKIDLEFEKQKYSKEVNKDAVYTVFDKLNIQYGASHRGIAQLFIGDGEVLAQVELPTEAGANESYVLNPALLDACFQASIGLFWEEQTSALPFAIDQVQVFNTIPDVCWVKIKRADQTSSKVVQKLDFEIYDAEGVLVVRVDGFSTRNTVKPTSQTAKVMEPEVKQVNGHESQSLLHAKTILYLKQQLSAVNKLAVERISENAPLEDYGIDSVMVMKLNKKLEESFGALSKTLFYEYQTINELATYFIEEHEAALKQLLGVNAIKVKEAQPVAVPQEEVFEAPALKRFSTQGKTPRVSSKSISAQEDIAIIGVAGRYPQAKNLNEFWDNLTQGKNSITEVPSERWDHSLYFDEDKNQPGKSYTKWGGFIDGVDEFDPLFFKISPTEAEALDPQERLFLQNVHSTLEDAGYTAEQLGSKVGVYAGVMYVEYPLFGVEETLKGNPMVLSGSPSSIANRASYFFNFRGPSIAVDTMCSSSITTVHMACQSIRNGECEVAIAGGVNVSIHPNKYLILSNGKFASSKGLCETFGEGGDGYVPGEGVGSVLLKPLSKAIADGDNIYGVVKGSAVNHGGKTNGYTVPNPKAQAEVVADAMKNAGISSDVVSYVEAHGTGTALGDPIEITGLKQAFGKEANSCAIGSVKSNIGHCEGAAGIAGITKVLLQMKHQQLVPSLHSTVLNKNIDFDNTPFTVQQSLNTWKRNVINGQQHPLTAGISSFGAGGANAHIILQEYVQEEEVYQAPITSENPLIVVLSAKNKARLKDRVTDILGFIDGESIDDAMLRNMAYTLQVGREAMPERLGLVVTSAEELKTKLEAYLNDSFDDIFIGHIKKNKDTLAIFLGDDDLQQAVNNWVKKGKYYKLLELWVMGLEVEWKNLYTSYKPKRVSLPTYPFAKDKYWAPLKYNNASLTATAGVKQLHPLVQENTSDFTQYSYSSTFSGNEFFLADHQVNGQKILPGVAYLEMAQTAIKKALGEASEVMQVELNNVVWKQPFIVEAHSTLNIRVELQQQGTLSYEIYSHEQDTEIVHCQGKAAIIQSAEVLQNDIKSIKDNFNGQQLSANQCYEVFNSMGLYYGAGHRVLDKVYASDREVIADLRLPQQFVATLNQYDLHPALLDGALQASIGMMLFKNELQGALPFAVEHVAIFGNCSEQMTTHIQYSPGCSPSDKVQKLDVNLYNQNGELVAKIAGFSARVIQAVQHVEKNEKPIKKQETVMLSPYYKNMEHELPSEIIYENHHIICIETGAELVDELQDLTGAEVNCEHYSSDSDTATRFTDYATAIFEKAKAIIKSKPKKHQLIQVFVPADKQWFNGLLGILKTIRLEHPKVLTQLVQVENLSAQVIKNKANREKYYPDAIAIKYQQNERYTESWKEVVAEPIHTWKDHGVYLITGGLGGLGVLFSKSIAQNTKGAKLILTGRTALSVEKSERLDALKAYGVTVEYQQVDITDEAAVDNLMGHIERSYHQLDGILHSAGVIDDNYIIRKNSAELKQVLAPKVTGLTNLDNASQRFNLDFMILFSSVAGATGSAGQADYAAGNAFMDVFAANRNDKVKAGERIGHTLSVNWPLWKDGGMHVDEHTETMLWQNMGMIPMPSTQGIEAMKRAFNSNESQVMILAGDAKKLKAFMKSESGEVVHDTYQSQEDEHYAKILKQIANGELSEEEFEKAITQ